MHELRKSRISRQGSKGKFRIYGSRSSQERLDVFPFDYWRVQVGSPEYRQLRTEHGRELLDEDERNQGVQEA
jgi:hypothetical protein